MTSTKSTVRGELADLATRLAGAAWRTKRERDWTVAERADYDRWARQEMDKCRAPAAQGEDSEIGFMTYEEGREAIGEFVRITLNFDSAHGDVPTGPSADSE